MQNSILANKPDLTEPRPIAVLPESRSLLSIRFSEALDPSSLALENFSLKPSIAFVRTFFKDISLTVIHVELEDTLRRRQTYSLEISNVRDCSGNRASISSIEFGVPERADSLDIIVNEILFNPSTGGVDFVEFRNVSLKFLQLRNWKIANDDGEGVTGVKPIMSNNMLLPPNGYVVFTTDPILVELQYPNSIAVNLIKTPLPSLPDDGGSIAIVDDNGKIVDKLSYSSSWHSAFLKSEEGVSLERIESVAPTQDSHNWTSASSRAGFATPGYVNSQQRIGHEFGEVEVVVVPEIFEAGAGVNDFTEIQYRFDVGGAIANVAILNYQGTVLKTISNNEILGPSGFLRWDGDRDNGSKAPAGYYIVWFEVFLSNGNVQTFRRRVIVASK